MANRSRVKLNKAKSILHQEGGLALFKVLLCFLRNLFLEYSSHNIYESTLDVPIIPCEVDNLTIRVITRPKEVDLLSGEGFSSSRLSTYKDAVSKGAILCCAFVGDELAHVCSVLIGRAINEIYPHSFARQYGHTVGLGSFTAPKYRRKGIHVHVRSKALRYLREKGLARAWDVQEKDNIAAQNAVDKLGYYFWGEGCHLRLLALFHLEWTRPKSEVARRCVRFSVSLGPRKIIIFVFGKTI